MEDVQVLVPPLPVFVPLTEPHDGTAHQEIAEEDEPHQDDNETEDHGIIEERNDHAQGIVGPFKDVSTCR